VSATATGELSGVAAIAQRDVIKLLRDRPRLLVNLAFPVLLIGGLGAILQPTVGRVTGLNAVTLAFTGVLAARPWPRYGARRPCQRSGTAAAPLFRGQHPVAPVLRCR
jgi:hypothetical protein